MPRIIGNDAYRIPEGARQLVDDVRIWIENETYTPDEIAVRFSHRLVSIQPFPKGNGPEAYPKNLSMLTTGKIPSQLNDA